MFLYVVNKIYNPCIKLKKKFQKENCFKKVDGILNEHHFSDRNGGSESRDQLTCRPACRASIRGQPF